MLSARRKDRLDQVAAELGLDHALAVETDVTQQQDLRDLASAAIARFGRIDALVSNSLERLPLSLLSLSEAG